MQEMYSTNYFILIHITYVILGRTSNPTYWISKTTI